MQIEITELKGEVCEKLEHYFKRKSAFIEVNPGNVILPAKFSEFGQNIIDLPVRKDDIWLVSYPRTGEMS